jgi:competence protein ComEC
VGKATRGCGCAVAVLLLVVGAAAYVGYKYALPWWRTKPPPASGRELRVHVLDVGPVNGDAILIVAPSGKTVLVDAGDTGKGKIILEALKRNQVQQVDYFIATHPHPDHIGGADEVLKVTRVLNVIDNGAEPVVPPGLQPQKKETGAAPGTKKPQPRKPERSKTTSVTKFFDEYKAAITQSGAHYDKAVPGTKYDLGDGAFLTVLAPSEPFFNRDQMKTGGNEPNANSIVLRLDYGDFSMLLPGDAEEQTEHRMLSKDLNLKAKILKVAHHGSKYATSADFLKRVQPEAAIVSAGAWNRYGHPAQSVLDRLRANGTKVYRTDLQGEITITTKGNTNDYKISGGKENATEADLWTGRVPQKDDSSRAGFIAYGDFGPPPKPKESARK